VEWKRQLSLAVKKRSEIDSSPELKEVFLV
jgi:hypothetical protein